MAAQALSLDLSSRTIRLSVAGCTMAILASFAISTVAGILDADDQIAGLEASHASFAVQGGSAKTGIAPPDPGQRRVLIASSKESAASLIQHSLQQSVEPPAKLESLHLLDASDEKGLVVVRASIRIRNLAPERVAAFVHRLEGTIPAILFDDLRVSIRTRPPVFGSTGPGVATETASAEVSGVVRTYATGTTEPLSADAAAHQP